MRFMKVLLNFLMTTVIGGLLALVPVALLVFILGDVLAMVAALVAPVAEILPVEKLGGSSVATLVALALIIGFCFLVGLVARTAIGSRLGGWVESAVLRRVPVYGMLKTLSPKQSKVEPMKKLLLQKHNLQWLKQRWSNGGQRCPVPKQV